MATELLTEDQIREALTGTEWQRERDEIVRTVTLADFKAAMAFVNQVADLAESANHHPDISISWNKVSLRLSTHSAGGLTSKDTDLARSIDRLIA
jgi:4a-hydroxytetrahydrobiopterin dehydratase